MRTVDFLPSIISVLVALAALLLVNKVLGEKFTITRQRKVFKRTVGGLIVFFTLVFFIILLPLDWKTKEQVFKLIGGIFAVLIAFSSTTFFSNLIAGIMLRIMRSYRVGDFIEAGSFFGRVAEKGILKTELQTLERDLITLPSLYLVQNPMRTLRNSGTVISTNVSLGYNEDITTIKKAMIKAAEKAGLEKPWISIISLNDFSVSYRVNGLLTDLDFLVSKRSALNEAVINELHAAGVEIVSPAFQNIRTHSPVTKFIPEAKSHLTEHVQASPDELLFDKALAAETLDKLKTGFDRIDAEVAKLKDGIKDIDEAEKEEIKDRIRKLEDSKERIKDEIEKREMK